MARLYLKKHFLDFCQKLHNTFLKNCGKVQKFQEDETFVTFEVFGSSSETTANIGPQGAKRLDPGEIRFSQETSLKDLFRAMARESLSELMQLYQNDDLKRKRKKVHLENENFSSFWLTPEH